MQKFIACLLFFLIPLDAVAQSGPSAIGGARFGGAQAPVQASESRFTLGLSLDGGLSFRDNAALDDSIRVIGTISPEPGDLGKTADIFVVDRVNLQFTMKDQDGNFRTWNGRVPDLVPALESVVLTQDMEVDVFTGKLAVDGDHRFFIGYFVDGVLRYTPSPLRLDITASGSGSGSSAFISFAGAEEELAQGKLISFDYQGPVLDQDDLSVTVDGRTLHAIYLNGQISFMLPPDLSGPLSFQINAGEESFAYSATIAPAPVIENPRQYVSAMVEELLAEWETSGQDWLAEDYSDLAENAALLGSLSEADVAALAVLIRQNVEPVLASGSAAALLGGNGIEIRRVQAASVDTCTAAMVTFTGTVISAVSNNRLVVLFVSAGVVTIGSPASPFLLGIGLGLLVNSLSNVENGVDMVWEACVEPLLAELRDDFDLKQGRAKPLSLDSRQIFDEDEARRLNVQLTYGFLDAGLRQQFLQGTASVRGILAELNEYVGGRLDSLIEAFPSTDASIEQADASTFSLETVSEANISGSIEDSSAESLSLAFTFVDPTKIPEEGYADFTFHLVSSALDVDLTVPARLYGKRPELAVNASGAALANIAGISPTESQLLFRTIQVGDGALEIPLTVSNTGTGPITLDAAGIQSGSGFTLSGPGSSPVLEPAQSLSYALSYTPVSGGFVTTSQGPAGAATLKFGQTGAPDWDYQVGVRVLISFAGTYEVTSVESSSEEGCANPGATFPVSVSAVDGVNRHVAVFEGNDIWFDWNGTSGISATGQLVYEEDEGTVTESVNVSIDLAGQVSGGSSWTWVSDDKTDSCSGSTSITGSKL